MFNNPDGQNPETTGWLGLISAWFLGIVLLVVLIVFFFFNFFHAILLLYLLIAKMMAYLVAAAGFAASITTIKQREFLGKKPEWFILLSLISFTGAFLVGILFYLTYLHFL